MLTHFLPVSLGSKLLVRPRNCVAEHHWPLANDGITHATAPELLVCLGHCVEPSLWVGWCISLEIGLALPAFDSRFQYILIDAVKAVIPEI